MTLKWLSHWGLGCLQCCVIYTNLFFFLLAKKGEKKRKWLQFVCVTVSQCSSNSLVLNGTLHLSVSVMW